MPRSIDQIQTMIVPKTSGGGGSNRNTALPLLFHPVHRRGAFVHFTDFVFLAGVKQNALANGSFAGINMSDDADVSGLFK